MNPITSLSPRFGALIVDSETATKSPKAAQAFREAEDTNSGWKKTLAALDRHGIDFFVSFNRKGESNWELRQKDGSGQPPLAKGTQPFFDVLFEPMEHAREILFEGFLSSISVLSERLPKPSASAPPTQHRLSLNVEIDPTTKSRNPIVAKALENEEFANPGVKSALSSLRQHGITLETSFPDEKHTEWKLHDHHDPEQPILKQGNETVWASMQPPEVHAQNILLLAAQHGIDILSQRLENQPAS